MSSLVNERNLIDLNRAGWLAARRYGVPSRMVEEATERRLAGDWLGACAAARFDVRFELKDIRSEFGADTADLVEEDLRHLVPDLVRWHLPRHWRGGSGLLEPGIRIPLASYGGQAGGPALWLRTGAHIERPQRVELRFGPVPAGQVGVDSWVASRYLWDARHSASLLERLGGGDRTPFFYRDGRRLADDELPTSAPVGDPVALTEWVMALQDAGRFEEAWQAAGVAADFSPPESDRPHWYSRRERPDDKYATVSSLVSTLSAEWSANPDSAVRVLLRSTLGGWARDFLCVTVGGGVTSATRIGRDVAEGIPTAPRPWWQRLPDLDLLRCGHLDASNLHPLVRAAMFPDERGEGSYQPVAAQVEIRTVPVRCRGVWHQVGWRDGRVDPRDHTPEEAQRERVMRSLGGEVPRCFSITETWRGTLNEHLPRQLRDLRHHALSALAHGDTDEFQRLLDGGMDPAGVRDRWGRGPLHYLARVDGERLLGRLLAAGLEINGTDLKGRTPLGWALFDGASAGLVHAMLAAGADVTLTDGMGESALHLLRSTEAATILPWLLDAGLDLAARDEYGRTPLMTQVISWAPPETIRATVAAGADVTAVDEWAETSVAEIAEITGRYDLEFLAGGTEPDD